MGVAGARATPCSGRGYLDHIDPFKEVMYLHCTRCCGERYESHEGRARGRRRVARAARRRREPARNLSGPWHRSPRSYATTPRLDGAAISCTSSASSRAGTCSPTSASPTCCSSCPRADPPDDDQFVVVGQVRPTTSQTLYRARLDRRDSSTRSERPLVARAMRLGEIIEGEITIAALTGAGPGAVHPGALRRQDHRACSPASRRRRSAGQPGELERTYVDIFNRFARMIAAGHVPVRRRATATRRRPLASATAWSCSIGRRASSTPRPTRVSALHRIGVHASLEGLRLGELGLDDEPVRDAFAVGKPVTEEVERRGDVTILVRCIPLHRAAGVSGAVLLVPRRHRGPPARPAAAVEGRHDPRDPPPGEEQPADDLVAAAAPGPRGSRRAEAKAAIEESVRRIQSIALVHETLSREAGEDVAFIEIVRPLVRMVEDGVSSPDRPVRLRGRGDGGRAARRRSPRRWRSCSPSCCRTPSTTPSPTTSTSGGARLGDGHAAATTAGTCGVRVIDDGVGRAAEGFSVEKSTGLGLSIVRALVTSDLGGTIDLRRGDGPPDRPGTIVELAIPVARPMTSDARPMRHGRDGAAECDRRPAGGARAGALADAADLRRGRRRSREARRCGAGERRTACAACGAPPRRCRPRSPESWLVARANSRHGGLGVALAADGLGVLDLLDGGAGGADREEQIRIGVTAGRRTAPFVRSMVRCRGRLERGPRVPPRR